MEKQNNKIKIIRIVIIAAAVLLIGMTAILVFSGGTDIAVARVFADLGEMECLKPCIVPDSEEMAEFREIWNERETVQGGLYSAFSDAFCCTVEYNGNTFDVYGFYGADYAASVSAFELLTGKAGGGLSKGYAVTKKSYIAYYGGNLLRIEGDNRKSVNDFLNYLLPKLSLTVK